MKLLRLGVANSVGIGVSGIPGPLTDAVDLLRMEEPAGIGPWLAGELALTGSADRRKKFVGRGGLLATTPWSAERPSGPSRTNPKGALLPPAEFAIPLVLRVL